MLGLACPSIRSRRVRAGGGAVPSWGESPSRSSPCSSGAAARRRRPAQTRTAPPTAPRPRTTRVGTPPPTPRPTPPTRPARRTAAPTRPPATTQPPTRAGATTRPPTPPRATTRPPTPAAAPTHPPMPAARAMPASTPGATAAWRFAGASCACRTCRARPSPRTRAAMSPSPTSTATAGRISPATSIPSGTLRSPWGAATAGLDVHGEQPNTGAYGGFSVISGDFDGDGRPDLVVYATYCTGSCEVDVLLGQGDGTFAQQPVVTGITSNKLGNGAAVADLNRDGKSDLVRIRGRQRRTPRRPAGLSRRCRRRLHPAASPGGRGLSGPRRAR